MTKANLKLYKKFANYVAVVSFQFITEIVFRTVEHLVLIQTQFCIVMMSLGEHIKAYCIHYVPKV